MVQKVFFYENVVYFFTFGHHYGNCSLECILTIFVVLIFFFCTHSRYHLETNSKYENLKPGKITDALRDALGISSRDIPDFIYRMRYLGYPPGELKTYFQKFVFLGICGRRSRYIRY